MSISRLLFLTVFTAVIITAGTNELQAQAKINSPYSRLGLGNFLSSDFHHINSMGGLSGAFNSPISYSLKNPASLAFMQSAAFDGGFHARNSTFTEGDQSINTWSGNIDYMSLGFTLKNPINEALSEPKISNFSWGSSISLIPMTQAGYLITDTENDINLGDIVRQYQGSGGTNALRWGVGAKIGELAFGLNADFMFGQISSSRRVSFPDLVGSFADIAEVKYSIRGVAPGFGMQYRWVLEKNDDEVNRRDRKVISMGIYGKFPTNFRVISDTTNFRVNSVLGLIDTLTSIVDIESRNNRMPLQIGGGIMYEEIGKLRLGFDFEYGDWLNFSSDAIAYNYANTVAISLGGEFIPNADAFGDYFKTVRYRAAASFRQDPRVFAGEQLNNMNVQVGVGLPIYMNRQLSMINIGLEYGTFAQNLRLNENYVKINFAFTLTDNLWFFKRRFN